MLLIIDHKQSQQHRQSNNEEESRTRRAATARLDRLWNNGVIPYEIEPHFSGYHRTLFRQAMRHWEHHTCIRFVERQQDSSSSSSGGGEDSGSSSSSIHSNYILFTERSCGCCSFVGKRGGAGGGAQAISIGKNCDKFGIVVHELGHVIGFWHEHTRPDRDAHVRIVMDHITPGQEYNFDKHTSDEVNSLGQPYDHQSIMHYARNTFAKQAHLDTIEPIATGGSDGGGSGWIRPEIGQRQGLSEGDIAQTRLLYLCPTCGRTIHDTFGTISSSSKFDPNSTTQYCEWYLSATHGERIVLNITEMYLYESDNCAAGYVEVRDGYWYRSPLIGRYCGSGQVLEPIISSGHRMLITYRMIWLPWFFSDSSSQSSLEYEHQHNFGFNATYRVICGGELVITNDNSGNPHHRLQSPNYPDTYRPNQQCVWKLRPAFPSSSLSLEAKIVLKFESFELERHAHCARDYLEILDGDGTLIGKYCGDAIPETISSSKSKSSQLLVRFVSDSTVEMAGFSAMIIYEINECTSKSFAHGCEHRCVNTLGSYRCECRVGYELDSESGKKCKPSCGGQIVIEANSNSSSSQNGYISSPSFPGKYPPNKHCIWQLHSPPSYSITVNFLHFNLEGNNQDCEYDRLEVKSGAGNGNDDEIEDSDLDSDHRQYQWNKLHGVFCGTNLPSPITSNTRHLQLQFHSDATVQYDGFRLEYFLTKDRCAQNNGGCQHVCRNVLKIDTNDTNDTDDGYICECHQGFVVDTNNKHACVEVNCFHQLSVVSTSAKLISPGYPTGYPNSKQCIWTLKATPGHRIVVRFVEFDLEPHQQCSYDFVDIYDGLFGSKSSSMLGHFCGNRLPHVIQSSTNNIWITFQSDATNNGFKGFKARYLTVCGGRLIADGTLDHIYSHAKFGDANYGANEDCDWKIVTSSSAIISTQTAATKTKKSTISTTTTSNTKTANKRIYLKFITFDLEPNNSNDGCAYDYVQIYDGLEDIRKNLIGQYCGDHLPDDILSSGSSILIRFRTDDSIHGKGFTLTYSAVDVIDNDGENGEDVDYTDDVDEDDDEKV